MRIEIDIPKEFEEHFNQDKFKDSLERIMADIFHSLEIGNCLCAGRYEYETIEMLEKALENSKTAYDVDKVIKELNKLDVKAITRYKGGTFGDYEGTDYYIKKSDAIEIVKQGGVSEEQKLRRVNDMLSIDEAIAFERQQAKDKRNEHYTFGIQKSKEAAEEHEQLAEWLEELKA